MKHDFGGLEEPMVTEGMQLFFVLCDINGNPFMELS